MTERQVFFQQLRKALRCWLLVKNVDGRDKPGHDGAWVLSYPIHPKYRSSTPR
jgi:hypothetical protein